MEHLGRYKHKIAISNHRIKTITAGGLTFSYKGYWNPEQSKKEMTLTPMEFIRRFSLHILPKRFVRIRHYGILSGTSKPRTLPVIRDILPAIHEPRPKEARELQAFSMLYCCHCKKESMVILEVLPRRGPPVPDRLKSVLRCF